METKNKKMAYESPAIKVVRFQVEKGFAASPLNLQSATSENYSNEGESMSQSDNHFGNFFTE